MFFHNGRTLFIAGDIQEATPGCWSTFAAFSLKLGWNGVWIIVSQCESSRVGFDLQNTSPRQLLQVNGSQR